MYFPTTNYKRTDHYRVMFLMSQNISVFEKIADWIGEGRRKTVFAWKFAQVFWVSVSLFLF